MLLHSIINNKNTNDYDAINARLIREQNTIEKRS